VVVVEFGYWSQQVAEEPDLVVVLEKVAVVEVVLMVVATVGPADSALVEVEIVDPIESAAGSLVH
jgi:hypothetical protein